MKTFTILLAGLLAFTAPLSAQAPQQSQGGPGGPGAAWKTRGGPHAMPPGAALTPDEQQRLTAAREKAKDDPTVRSLKEAKGALESQLDSAMHSAMLAADSSLAPVLEKIKGARDRAKDMRGKFDSLAPEQKEQLKRARYAAKDDPAVAAARQKLEAATDPESKRAAAMEMHEAVKAAVLKSNPDLAPLLEELRPGNGFGKKGFGGPKGAPGQPGGPPPPPPMDENPGEE